MVQGLSSGRNPSVQNIVAPPLSSQDRPAALPSMLQALIEIVFAIALQSVSMVKVRITSPVLALSAASGRKVIIDGRLEGNHAGTSAARVNRGRFVSANSSCMFRRFGRCTNAWEM
jgi:hypothetical protein